MGPRSLVSRRRAVVCVPAVAAVLSLGGATSALAGTASVSGSTLNYTAAAGENNILTAQRNSPTSVTVREFDPDATLTPGAGCTQSGAKSVTCTSGGDFTAGVFDLGDGDDELDASSFQRPGLTFPMTVTAGKG